MPKHSDWRSAAAYDYVNDLDPAELAWAFLRRNPDYHREYRMVLRLGGEEALAERWGLSFRDRPGEGGRPGGRVLAPAYRSVHHSSCARACGFSTAASLAGLTPAEQHVASDGAYFVVRHESGRITAAMLGCEPARRTHPPRFEFSSAERRRTPALAHAEPGTHGDQADPRQSFCTYLEGNQSLACRSAGAPLRIHFHPHHGSWLNLVEGFFSKLARSVLRHIRVSSKQELKDRLMAAVDYFNHDPVVHTWTYKPDKAA